MKDWKEQLKAIRDSGNQQLSRKPVAKAGNPRSERHRDTVTISLGIDFGTTFTKVVWRNLNTDQSGTVALPAANDNSAFPESVVYVMGDDRCLMPWDQIAKSEQPRLVIRYLKMHLTGRGFGRSPQELLMPSATNANEISFTLAAFYLARACLESRKRVKQVLGEELVNRNVEWVGCLGVPDAEYDSRYRETFESLGRASWDLSLIFDKSGLPLTPHISELTRTVTSIQAQQSHDEQPVNTYPEIGAAVLSFLVSPSARPGVYVYFDIGGGTFDGVAFRFRQQNNERLVEYYSAAVESLGVDAVVDLLLKAMQRPPRHVVESTFLDGKSEVSIPLGIDAVKEKVQSCVARIIVDARRCDDRDWIQNDTQKEIAEWLRRISSYKSNSQKLIVFLGGGGAGSHYHRQWIGGTHGARQHLQAGIPQYDLQMIPQPEDFRMDLAAKPSHSRLAVAYGLSAAIGTAIGISGLPSHATFKKVRKAHIDFDSRAREVYGEII